MSAVLRKKISAAGSLPPKVLQCAPLWDALVGAAKRWAADVYGHELEARISGRQIVRGAAAQKKLAERFSFVSLTKTGAALLAISIDRPGAARYAAERLHQSTDSLLGATDLFLKLMSEQPASKLWRQVRDAISDKPASEDILSLGDPAAVSDAIEPDVRLAQINIVLAAEGSEDGWLLEGGEEPPEIRLFFDLERMEKLAADIRGRKKGRSAGYGASDSETVRTRLRQSSIRLDVVLDSLGMTIADCSRFEIGQVLPLAGTEGGQLMLCAETMNGQAVIAQGEMGNWKGQRALKLNGPVIESYIREIADI